MMQKPLPLLDNMCFFDLSTLTSASDPSPITRKKLQYTLAREVFPPKRGKGQNHEGVAGLNQYLQAGGREVQMLDQGGQGIHLDKESLSIHTFSE